MRRAALLGAAALGLALAGCSGPHDEVISKVNEMADGDQYMAAHRLLEAEIRQAPESSELLELRLDLLLRAGQSALAADAYRALEHVADVESDLPVSYLKTGTPAQQLTAIQTISLLGGDRWISPLMEKFKAPEPETRRNVIAALGDLRSTRATDLLIQALQDENWAVRGDAAQALGKLRDAKAVIPLFEAMGDEDNYVVLGCGNALLSIAKEDDTPVELYAKYTSSPRKEVRKIALIGLALNQDKRATEGLIELAKSSSGRDQYQALRALGRSGDAAAAPVIREALSSEVPGIRIQAIESLGLLRDSASIPQLKKIVTSKQEPYEIKRKAAVAMLQIVEEDKSADPETSQVKAE